MAAIPEGIDVDNIDVPDLDTLQAALNRAVERHNMTPFHPGRPRPPASDHDPAAGDRGPRPGRHHPRRGDPATRTTRSPDHTVATVAGCIGVALGLLDDWLTSSDPHAPKGLGLRVRLPSGHWLGERAATDILVLARKGRAFGSLNTLITRQGGEHVLYGSALTLAATLQTWATDTDTPVLDLIRAAVR